MKKLIIGIIIGLSISAPLTYAGIRYIQIPEYIKGYNTLELLNYLADLKTKEDKSKIVVPPTNNLPTNNPIKKEILKPLFIPKGNARA